MKKTILIITTVLLFTGCSFSQSQSNIHYTFGVIETSSARKYTVIKYYNDDGKKVASTKLDEAQVGTSFNTTSYHDGYAYINNIGLQGHKNPQNIIQIKGNSTEVNKLHLPGTAIDAVSADDHYYYGVSNLNDYGYLTQMNFKEKKVNEIKGYKIYRATSQNGKYSKIATVSSKKTSYKDYKLSQGKVYFYRIRTYKNRSGKKLHGQYSEIKSAITGNRQQQ